MEIKAGTKFLTPSGMTLVVERVNGEYIEFAWDRKKESCGSGCWRNEIERWISEGAWKIID